MKSNLILTGMPGAGKSTVGVVLAKVLGYDFLDLDILIAKEQGRPIQEILDIQGVEAFLAIEEAAGISLQVEKTVLAPGGSIVLSPPAMANLKQNGLCVYLEVPLEELRKRLTHSMDSRGIAAPPGVTLEDIFAMRRPLYERYADLTIPCAGKCLEQVVAAILEEIKP